MADVSGKDVEFWFDSKEIDVTVVEDGSEYDESDITSTAVESPHSKSMLGRRKETVKVDTVMRASPGVEVATGDLVAGTSYRVTAGSIVETQGTFTVGQIFESDGSGDATADNKVVPLGVEFSGKNIAVKVNSSEIPVTSFKYTEQYAEHDTTKSTTSTEAKEFITGREKTTSTIEMIMDSATADQITASAPTAQPIEVDFDANATYKMTGTAIFKKKAAVHNAAGDAVKVTYDVVWSGIRAYTFDATVWLPAGIAKAIKVISKRGSSTNKERTGNAIVMSRSIETDLSSAVKASFGLNWTGAVTEAVAN